MKFPAQRIARYFEKVQQNVIPWSHLPSARKSIAFFRSLSRGGKEIINSARRRNNAADQWPPFASAPPSRGNEKPSRSVWDASLSASLPGACCAPSAAIFHFSRSAGTLSALLHYSFCNNKLRERSFFGGGPATGKVPARFPLRCLYPISREREFPKAPLRALTLAGSFFSALLIFQIQTFLPNYNRDKENVPIRVQN